MPKTSVRCSPVSGSPNPSQVNTMGVCVSVAPRTSDKHLAWNAKAHWGEGCRSARFGVLSVSNTRERH